MPSTMPGRAWGAVRAVPAAGVAVFMGLFFALPVAAVVRRGLGGAGPGAPFALLGSGSVRGVLWFTLWQAAASTVLTVAAALPAAGAVARLRFRGRRLFRALLTVPFVLPTIVVAAAFEGLFDRFGLDGGGLRMRHTVWAILLAHVFFNYAVVVRIVGAHWALLDTRMEDQARVLGAYRLQVFREIALPRLAPAVAASAAIVFLFTFTSFGVILVLGGPSHATLETEIYRHAIRRLDLTAAASLAVLQLAAVTALVATASILERRTASAEPVSGDASTRRGGLGSALNLSAAAVLLGLPLATLVERSLSTGRDTSYSLRNYTALTERVALLPETALAATGNSLAFAAQATVLALTVGAAAAMLVLRCENPPVRREARLLPARRVLGRVLDVGLTIPLGVSAVTMGLGYLLVLDGPPIDLRSSAAVVPIAHAVVGIPFVVRTLVTAMRSVNPSLREAASVLGASPLRMRSEVELPVAARALAVGAGFAFAVSLGEFGATSFIPRSPETLTAPWALYRLLGMPGDALRGQAMALAVLLMAVIAAAVLAMDSLGGALNRRGAL